jgi:hypothetical protein
MKNTGESPDKRGENRWWAFCLLVGIVPSYILMQRNCSAAKDAKKPYNELRKERIPMKRSIFNSLYSSLFSAGYKKSSCKEKDNGTID